MIVALVVLATLAVATLSAVAAYRCGSAAWDREYNAHRMGLAIEVAFLFLTFASAAAIALIMKDAFETLYFRGAWRSPFYLGAMAVIAGGVAIYAIAVAPGSLAKKQGVAAGDVARECRLPYLLYAPFSILSWIGAILPVLALIIVSIHADSREMHDTKQGLTREAQTVVAQSAANPATAKDHAGIYNLAYRESLDAVQRMASRYLWVVGVFMVSIMVILNTRITSSFTEESLDAFKWLMWVLLAVALGVCLYGFGRYQVFRDLALETQTRLQALAGATGNLNLLASSREALLVLRNQGPVTFIQMTLASGSLALMFFGYAMQIVLAKVTNRSVLAMIFPSPVARFLDSFMLGSEEAKG
jgi:hypothetical protein